jgi:ribonuclease-3
MKLLKKIFSKKKSRSEQDEIFFNAIYKIIGLLPVNIDIYKKSFTHRSSNRIDSEGNQVSYERLEFLGDAMLSAVIAAHLFKIVPAGDEGYLTKMRSKIVSREHLNELGKDLDLIALLDSKALPKHFGENIHGNIFEALIGAIYLDLGFDACERFIYQRVVEPYVDIARLEGKVISYKSLLIEWCQKKKRKFAFEPYEDHTIEGEKFFAVKLIIDDQIFSKARATSKKRAEEKAAQRAYFKLQESINLK